MRHESGERREGRLGKKTVLQAPWIVAKMAFKPEYQYLDKFSMLKFLIYTMIYTRHAQHTARGPNVARGNFLSDPQSPEFWIFSLNITQKHAYKMYKHVSFGPWTRQQNFFWPAMRFELCTPNIHYPLIDDIYGLSLQKVAK